MRIDVSGAFASTSMIACRTAAAIGASDCARTRKVGLATPGACCWPATNIRGSTASPRRSRARISGHADDEERGPLLVAVDGRDAETDRIAAGEEPVRERFVDDADLRRCERVAVLDVASLDQPHAQRREVVGANGIHVCFRVAAGRAACSPRPAMLRVENAAAEQPELREGRAPDAGCLTDAFEERLAHRVAPRGIVDRRAKVDARE